MEEIIYSSVVGEKLQRLAMLLLEKEYFGFLDAAENYVQGLADFIYTIPYLPLRKTKNEKHGKYYARYVVKNKRTQYYITFNTKGDGRYFIKNIFS